MEKFKGFPEVNLTEEENLNRDWRGLARGYLRWYELRNKELSRTASKSEIEELGKTLIIVGRPAFLSQLTTKEREEFEKALAEVEGRNG